MKDIDLDTGALDPAGAEFYCRTMTVLQNAEVPFLVGGAYAYARYTGLTRHTKDLDVFLLPSDLDRALDAFRRAGMHAEVPFPHWLAKVIDGEYLVDLIFGSGNGLAVVDEEWFQRAREDELLGRTVRLVPPEEMIWSKAFIMERERFDGADIMHLVRALGPALDWPRLLRRFGPHWRVLLSHLILFDYVYPCDRACIPPGIIEQLVSRLGENRVEPIADGRLCRGTLLSRAQYLPDVHELGYVDARVQPQGRMSEADTATWTAAVHREPGAAVPKVSKDDCPTPVI